MTIFYHVFAYIDKSQNDRVTVETNIIRVRAEKKPPQSTNDYGSCLVFKRYFSGREKAETWAFNIRKKYEKIKIVHQESGQQNFLF